MPIFDYKCSCGDSLQDVFVTHPDQFVHCLGCGREMVKDFRNTRVGFKPDIPEHFNESLGVVVKSRRDFREKLYLSNSRTDDIDPTGGLTPEERAERNGQKDTIPVLNKTVFDKRKQLGWGNKEMIEEVTI